MEANFSNKLINWYRENKRDLPWRNTTNPYNIWLSEIILQQTRVAQGLPYYVKFVKAFPTVKDLALADEQRVLTLWQGLGYYSRARNLHAAAKMVMNDFSGVFPKSYDDLIKLKGVGVYTASAVASFTNNESVAVVDGNVYRVLSRLHGVDLAINSTEGEKYFLKLANQLLDSERSAEYNQAIMEFGALACTPKKPMCNFCPFKSSCIAFNTNKVLELPVKLKKVKVKKRYFNFCIVINDKNEVLIQKRQGKGIWQHLFQFPLIETDKTLIVGAGQDVDGEFLLEQELLTLNKPHKLSHQHLYIRFFKASILDKDGLNDLIWVSVKDLHKYPFPIVLSNFIKYYF